LITVLLLDRDPLSHTVIPAAIDGQDLDFLLKEQESADVSLENEKIRYSKRANKKKDFDIIDSSILEKRSDIFFDGFLFRNLTNAYLSIEI